MSKERFFKLYRKDTNKEVYGSGAILLYKILWNNLARKYWNDTPGYPLKSDYYNKGMLACSIPTPRLIELSGYGERKVKGWIKTLETNKWIVIERRAIIRQNVFVLGKHEGVGDKYRECLFKDEQVDLELTQEQKQENWVKKMDPLLLLDLNDN